MRPLFKQEGVAALTAMMLMALIGGVSLFVLQNAMIEKMIASYVKRQAASLTLAESGIEQVLYWFTYPEQSPNPVFFRDPPCAEQMEKKDTGSYFDYAYAPFSDSQERGEQVTLAIHNSMDRARACRVISTTHHGKGVAVDLGRNPMPRLKAGIQGQGTPDSQKKIAAPIFVHWGDILYTGPVYLGDLVTPIPVQETTAHPAVDPYRGEGNIDPVLTIKSSGPILPSSLLNQRSNLYQNEAVILKIPEENPVQLKSFIKQYGRYLTLSDGGCLKEKGMVNQGKCTFQEFFSSEQSDGGHALVFIDTTSGDLFPSPLEIGPGVYKGYFYFAGDIHIVGGGNGRAVRAKPPDSIEKDLKGIQLEGFFYTPGKISLEHRFWVYGAIFAGKGFIGNGTHLLEIWYNDRFKDGDYQDIAPMTRIQGTWRTM